jgi:hypothetical protein
MQQKRILVLSIGMLGVVTSAFVALPAHSEEAVNDARELFREGRQLAAAGSYNAACRKFELSLQLEAGVGTQFNLADCWEHLGRTASAHRLFLEVARATSSQDQSQRSLLAQERADRLLPKLTRLQIQCDGDCPEEIHVAKDGVEQAGKHWAEPAEVDPGLYQISTRSRSGVKWSTRATVSSDPGIVVVSIPDTSRNATQSEAQAIPSSPSHPAKGLKAATVAETSAVTSEASDGARSPRTTNLRTLGNLEPLAGNGQVEPKGNSSWILPAVSAGVGIAGFAVAGGSALWLRHTNDKAKAICPTSESCTSGEIQSHADLVHEAKFARVGVYTGLTIGVFGIATAAFSHYFAKRRSRERDPVHSAVLLSPIIETGGGYWGAMAEGRF